jgi:DNA-directed RNA polymerase subunit M/transcription elongation factor TFIIS
MTEKEESVKILTEKEEYVKKFSKFMGKKNTNILVDHIIDYSNKYAENNNCLFLVNEITNTKVSYLLEILKKNNYLKDLIKSKKIELSNICNLRCEIIEPDKYKHILEKKELEEYRKNNQVTSNAFKCKKCGERKCQVTQKQTRSGDEPATTYVTCIECDYLFKF